MRRILFLLVCVVGCGRLAPTQTPHDGEPRRGDATDEPHRDSNAQGKGGTGSIPGGMQEVSPAPAEMPAPSPIPDPNEPPVHIVQDEEGWEKPDWVKPEPLPVAHSPIPPGFPEVDQYSSHAEACLAIVQQEVPKKKKTWRRAIMAWCEHRSYHSSRNGVVVSKVDGTQIHDRDRPTAWKFYNAGVLNGTLDPKGCPFHSLNPKQRRHPRKCIHLRKNWPYKNPKMTVKMANEWRAHSHDAERFGAQGPHDHNARAYEVIPGCWDPKQLWRFDVAMTVTVLKSMAICEKYGCRTKMDIKKHW